MQCHYCLSLLCLSCILQVFPGRKEVVISLRYSPPHATHWQPESFFLFHLLLLNTLILPLCVHVHNQPTTFSYQLHSCYLSSINYAFSSVFFCLQKCGHGISFLQTSCLHFTTGRANWSLPFQRNINSEKRTEFFGLCSEKKIALWRLSSFLALFH